MPPKSKPPAEAEPRRSTRWRVKRPAEELSEEEPEIPKQPRKTAAPKSQGADGQAKSSSATNGTKGKAAATRRQDNNEDTSAKAAKASKSTKATKQQAAKLSKAAQVDAKQDQDEASADSTVSTQAAQNPSTVAAAANSGEPGPSNDNQAAAADPACPKAHSTRVAGDADVMLNQTNINANNNKFYRMQLLQEAPSDHWLWTRWGRVGDKGQSQLQGPFDADTGLKEFKKKFRCASWHTALQMYLIIS